MINCNELLKCKKKTKIVGCNTQILLLLCYNKQMNSYEYVFRALNGENFLNCDFTNDIATGLKKYKVFFLIFLYLFHFFEK